MTGTRLTVAGTGYELPAGTDVEALKRSIGEAIRAGGGYVPITAVNRTGTAEVFFSAEIPHSFESVLREDDAIDPITDPYDEELI